jgi:integrase
VLVKTLKEHKLASRFSKPDDLIFCNGAGNSENLSNIVRRGLIPAWREAGIIGRYGGMHSLRHFYASWCINRKVDGGRELPAKIVSERLGHSSIVVTMDVYGHLFPAQAADEGFDDAAALLAMRTD